ncbi:transcriptional regulator [Nocardiopsis sp. CT-R113]|uniref:Transcriptional regulator n=1 Tax=Nocardiopsis codii TaxID=3065942 RepID=A0ABU7KD37_9ACTN|nr:transcriptional regulator [Nocardiopsis sp. CT-R113]MEE2040145.1 transcriptional regulator [Nocardiopsis sp. CT-R113]
MDPTVFAAVFAALFAGHQVGDHWAQTSCQAAEKGDAGWSGRAACARHVTSLAAVKVAFLAPVVLLSGMDVHPVAVAAGLGVDAVSHYWADRRAPLARLADRLGRGEFYRFGSPRAGRDDNPSLGTGAYALDQSWHVGWGFVASLIVACGATV